MFSGLSGRGAPHELEKRMRSELKSKELQAEYEKYQRPAQRRRLRRTRKQEMLARMTPLQRQQELTVTRKREAKRRAKRLKKYLAKQGSAHQIRRAARMAGKKCPVCGSVLHVEQHLTGALPKYCSALCKAQVRRSERGAKQRKQRAEDKLLRIKRTTPWRPKK